MEKDKRIQIEMEDKSKQDDFGESSEEDDQFGEFNEADFSNRIRSSNEKTLPEDENSRTLVGDGLLKPANGGGYDLNISLI